VTSGVFIATPVGPTGKSFTILDATLNEMDNILKEMAAKSLEETITLLVESGAPEEETRAYEVFVDLPKDYHGFAVTCTGPRRVTYTLTVAARTSSLALFKNAVEACRTKIYTIVEELARESKVTHSRVRDLHLAFERELGEFKL
jgi:hypothetical protein